MEMKINSSTVKQLRSQKLWSQDELATASGVGLRTIQRLEANGQASAETIKALAAAFEIDSKVLQEENHKTDRYFNIQLGYPIILIFIAIALVATWSLNTQRIDLTV